MGTTSQRLEDADIRFHLGMMSDAEPSILPTGYVFNTVNMMCRGGVLQTRPGYRCKTELFDGNLQGGCVYRPKAGIEQMVVVVEGRVFVAPWPFVSFRLLSNILLSPYSKQVFFCLGEQTQERRSLEVDAPIDFITPRSVLFIQDGGTSACAWYDGSNSGQARDDQYGIPVGGPMRYVGNRLWVAGGSRLTASDIGNPFSFRERTYPGGVAAITYPLPISALAETPGVVDPDLLVFTEERTYRVRANIRTRSTWETTDDFNTPIFPVGTYSQRSVTVQNGMLWWFSPRGLIRYDAAEASNVTSTLPLFDSPMTISKVGLSGDQSLVAGASFGSFLLMSIPHGDIYNTHTWVMDTEPSQEKTLPWQGIWTGTRPVEWMSGPVAGAERIFYVSKDYDGKNRLWEAFIEERADNGCPISWLAETRGYFGPTWNSDYPKLADKRFCYAELQMAELIGKIDVGVWWAGVHRGAYKQCLVKQIQADEGCISWDKDISEDTPLYALKPQSRRVKTQDVRESDEADGTSAGVERDQVEEKDDAFQLLIAGSGQAAIRWIRVFAAPVPQDLSGDCEPSESDVNMVRFDGRASEGADYEEALEPLNAALVVYESTKTHVLERDDVSVTGTGYATSIVSQADADKIAQAIAVEQAERMLENALPPYISDGKSFSNDGI
jgi:hypothetical protein